MHDCKCQRCQGFCYIRVPGTAEDFVQCPACGIACSIIEELEKLDAHAAAGPSAGEHETLPISDDPSNLVIIVGPNKLYNLYGRDVEDWLATNLNEDQVREWFAVLAAEYASDTIAAMARGEKPYGENAISYAEVEAKIRRKMHAHRARLNLVKIQRKAS